MDSVFQIYYIHSVVQINLDEKKTSENTVLDFCVSTAIVPYLANVSSLLEIYRNVSTIEDHFSTVKRIVQNKR